MSQVPPAPAIEIENLLHLYSDKRGGRRFLLDVPNLLVPATAWTSIVGPSGCGKTTLQNCLSLLRMPSCPNRPIQKFVMHEHAPQQSSGVIRHDIARILAAGGVGQREIAKIRRRLLGFYVQTGELIPTLTAGENVAMPLELNAWPRNAIAPRVADVLGYLLQVKPAEIPNKPALEFSGGQYQRIALARAIVHKPQFIFLDEPTSNLDGPTARRALDLMAKLVAEECATVIMVTHDTAFARHYSDFLIHMSNPAVPWKSRVDVPQRDEDGWGTISRWERKIQSRWYETDSGWVPVSSQTRKPPKFKNEDSEDVA